MNYKQQLNIIQGLFIPPDTQMRMDCPFCKNLNTLSVDTTENNINWYCFHASCKARGKKEEAQEKEKSQEARSLRSHCQEKI